MELLEKYKCKYCPELILSGFRCLECYIKKAGEIPKKQDKPFIAATRRDLYVQTDTTGVFTTDAGNTGTCVGTAAFNTFAYDGGASTSQPTFIASNSTALGFCISHAAEDLKNSVQSTE